MNDLNLLSTGVNAWASEKEHKGMFYSISIRQDVWIIRGASTQYKATFLTVNIIMQLPLRDFTQPVSGWFG